MAKLQQGILGPFSGKVGTVVGYQWKGRHCLRSYRCHIAYPNTTLQQTERQWFVAMVRFAAQARQALLLGLRQKAENDQMTEGNAFVRMNKACFSVLTQNPPHGTTANTSPGNPDKNTPLHTLTIDYQHIKIAEGPAAPVHFTSASVDENNTLHADFQKNTQPGRARPDDRVYIYAYCPSLAEGILTAHTSRSAKHLHTALPDHWRGRELHFWGFVIDRDGRPSNSNYIGNTSQTKQTQPTPHITTIKHLENTTIQQNTNPIEGSPDQPQPNLRT